MAEPGKLPPLVGLPILIKKRDTVLGNDHIQNDGRAKVHRYSASPKPMVTLLIVSLIITGEFLRYASVLFTADDLKSIIEGKTIMTMAKILTAVVFILLVGWSTSGGPAWRVSRLFSSLQTPNGPPGWPVVGSWTLMQSRNLHRELATLAWAGGASTRKLMAVSVGSTRIALTSDPGIAKEILRSVVFGDRPVKQAALEQGFEHAIGFAPQGPYWRHLRKIAVSHMFCHQQIVKNFDSLQHETSRMISAIAIHALEGVVSSGMGLCLRPYLQRAAVNNVMSMVFGRTFSFGGACPEAEAVEAMIRQGFELLGSFNCADHLPAFLGHLPLPCLNPVSRQCRDLTRRVQAFVQPILDDKRGPSSSNHTDSSFVDVLLALEGDQSMSDHDMISVLWEMVFRGTDTIAVLTEWALAEVILNPSIQAQIHKELDDVVGRDRRVQHKDLEHLPYLQAVLKETLRAHPPGPLLSWARLATEDAKVADYHVPRGTTAMVNMWAITHDAALWPNPHVFDPSRFREDEGGVDLDVLGTDLRLAPFGSGRRVCPGRALGMATAQLWLARLLHHFSWSQDCTRPVDLTEHLKLSCEMASPLHGCATARIQAP